MIKKFINKLIFSRRKEIPFIIFFSFLITFVISRLVAYSIHMDRVPDFIFFVRTVYVKGYHIHHFNFGIALLIVAGFLSFIDVLRTYIRWIAMLYGVGLALIMDEFNLLITLQKESYWSQGRYDAVILTSVVMLNVVYFSGFWKAMGRRVFKRYLNKQKIGKMI